MLIYFGGAEIPGHRTLLTDEGVEAMSLSYMGLRRRVKFARPWSIAAKFTGPQAVFLDSGAHTVNKDEEAFSQNELVAIAEHYKDFVSQNLDRLTMVSEFDALPLGREWIVGERETFWSQIPDGKFLPIWHPEIDGVDGLDRLAQQYERIGVPTIDAQGRNLIPLLNGLVQQYGTKLHGVNMSKVDDMALVKWDSISTISWLSPSQYGDTIIWTGKELKRYPKKYKEQSRKRWRTYLADQGFDAEAIEDDDKREVLRLSIWSWQQLAANVDKQRPEGRLATMSAEEVSEPNSQTGGDGVDTQPGTDVERVSTAPVRIRDERKILPVLGLESVPTVAINPETGEKETIDTAHIRSRSQSMRLCRSCFLAKKCPAFEEDSNCAYDIPIEIKTKDQFRSSVDALIEMQMQRVLFMKMAEDMEGGYADPNLSSEIDRLVKMQKTKADLEQEGFSLKIEAKERGQVGMISRLFGKDAGETARQLESPMAVEDLAYNMDVVEAEVIEG